MILSGEFCNVCASTVGYEYDTKLFVDWFECACTVTVCSRSSLSVRVKNNRSEAVQLGPDPAVQLDPDPAVQLGPCSVPAEPVMFRFGSAPLRLSCPVANFSSGACTVNVVPVLAVYGGNQIFEIHTVIIFWAYLFYFPLFLSLV